MSLKERILTWFIDHPDDVIDNEGLREALGIDDAQQVSVALNALHNEVGLKRDKKPEGGRGLDWWLPKAVAAELKLERTVTGKGAEPGITAEVAPTKKERKKAERTVRTKRAAKKFKAAGRSKRAKPLPRISRKSKRMVKRVGKFAVREIKNVTHGYAPPVGRQTPAPDSGPTATFGIRDDGALGITDLDENNVRLDRAQVKRLRDFLETTSPLWS